MSRFAEGYYNCQIVSQRFGESEKNKTPFFAITVIPTEMIDIATGGVTPVTGATPVESDPMYITEGTMKQMFPSQCRALGCDGVDFNRLGNPQHPQYLNLAGRVVRMRNEHSQGQKDPTKSYDGFTVVTEGPVKKSDPNVAMRLQTLFGRDLQQKTAGAVIQQPPVQAQTPVQQPVQAPVSQQPVQAPQAAPEGVQQQAVTHQAVVETQPHQAPPVAQTTQHQGLPF